MPERPTARWLAARTAANDAAAEDAVARMALATDCSGIGIWDWSPDSGKLLWDAMTFRLHGLVPATDGLFSYAAWRMLVHPDDLTHTEQQLNAGIDGPDDYAAEFRVLWPDGSQHHLKAAGRVTRRADGRVQGMVGACWDITEARDLAVQLQRQHELLRVTLMSIGDAVITTGADGRVMWLNPVAERMTGWPCEAARGRPLQMVFQLIHEETRAPIAGPLAARVGGEAAGRQPAPAVLVSRRGEEFGIEESTAPIRNEQGEVLGTVMVFHDVTEKRRLAGEIGYRATHDALTGLLNRSEFDSRLRRLLDRAREDHALHALLYIDLDRFKVVNDTCGHAVGDAMLQEFTHLLGECVRARDTLARLGGDEFAILLEHCALEQAERIGRQICERMEGFCFRHDGQIFRIGTSIGLVPVDQRWTSASAIQQAADGACYAAKKAGRNRVHIWCDGDLEAPLRVRDQQWAKRLARAIDENRFVLFGQRIESLQQPRPGIHAEVLLRLVDERESLVDPAAFLPAAERFHLTARLDPWVVAKAIAWLQSLPSLAAVELLGVNLCAPSVGDRAVHRRVAELLQAAGPAVTERLCFEIQESTAMSHPADCIALCALLRSLGARVALGGFGGTTGGFQCLRGLPVDFVKIDGQFMRRLLIDPLDEAAVRSFADVARVVGTLTVAQFVDQPAVLERVRAMGIDFAQGFHLHEPEPIECLLDAG